MSPHQGLATWLLACSNVNERQHISALLADTLGTPNVAQADTLTSYTLLEELTRVTIFIPAHTG